MAIEQLTIAIDSTATRRFNYPLIAKEDMFLEHVFGNAVSLTLAFQFSNPSIGMILLQSPFFLDFVVHLVSIFWKGLR
jgi:hypothetical protein